MPDTYYTNDDFADVINLWRLHQIWHKVESAERQKNSFPRESAENADLLKPVLNKVMTTHK